MYPKCITLKTTVRLLTVADKYPEKSLKAKSMVANLDYNYAYGAYKLLSENELVTFEKGRKERSIVLTQKGQRLLLLVTEAQMLAPILQ